MKLIIKQKKLLEKLNYAVRGVDNRNTLPILNCIKLTLTSEGLDLFSTDNDKAIKTFIHSNEIEEIIETGDILVEGRLFYEYIKKFNDKDILSLEVIENFLEISNNTEKNKTETRIVCRDVNEYPNIIIEESNNPIKLNKKTFKNLLNQTLFATSNQESRPVLTGLNIIVDNNILIATSTDAYRLAKKEVELNENYNLKANIVVPTRNLNELTKMIDDKESDIYISIFDNKIIFKFNDILMMSNLINDTYPNISNIIPKSYELFIKLDSFTFLNALDRVSLLSSENDKNAIIMETDDNKNIMLISNNPETGKSTEVIYPQEKLEKSVKVAFSATYMMEAIKAINAQTIEILYIDELKPIVIKDVDDDKLIQLILPVRLYF